MKTRWYLSFIIFFCTFQVALQGQEGHNWMSCLDDSLRLTEVTIPGTHDSGAEVGQGSHTLFAQDYADCQELNVSQQLNAGVRFLDLRVSEYHGSFKIGHGNVMYYNFDAVANWITGFLTASEEETVIVSLKCNGGDCGKVDNHLNVWIENIDSTMLYRKPINLDVAGQEFPKLTDVRGKIVLLYRYNDSDTLEWGIDADHSPNNWKDDVEFTTNNLRVFDHYTPRAANRHQHRYRGSLKNFAYKVEDSVGSTGKLHLNFWSATHALKTPRDWSEFINDHVADEITNHDHSNFGVQVADFMTEALAKKIYMNNFKHMDPSCPSSRSSFAEKKEIDFLEIYPNPTVNMVNLNFELETGETIKYVIKDINGRTVRMDQINGYSGVNKHRLDVSFLENGTYLIQCFFGKGIQSRKLVVLQ